MKLLSIVFSFRNEEQNLEELIKRTVSTLDSLNNWNYESEIPMNITTKYDGKSFWRHNSDY